VRYHPATLLGFFLFASFAQPLESAPIPVDPPALNSWVSPDLRDHRLVGLIWSESEQKFITAKTFIGKIGATSHLLLGERHDNTDHHRLQAWVISQVAKYRDVVVGFEMLDEPDKEPLKSVERFEQFADAVNWSKSGWPEFEIYAPLFEAVYRSKSPVLAVHPSRKRLMGIARSVNKQPVDTWGTISQKGLDNLVDDITKSHCGYADKNMVVMMSAAQRFKDHWMVKELMEQSGSKPFVLVAGNGHVRKDYGVPNHLSSESISIGFVEVYKEYDHPQDYDAARFDYIWFTPRVDNLDPCEKYKEQLEKMKKHYQHKKK